jgi:hypothetical protein
MAFEQCSRICIAYKLALYCKGMVHGLGIPCVGETHFGFSGFVICMKFDIDYEIWKQSKKRQVKLLNALMISCSFVNHRGEDG